MAVNQTLSVTEVAGSVNNSANTSKVRILWTSTQSGDSRNEYTRIAKYYVSINGGAETEYSVTYTLPKATTTTIVDVTLTVPHKDDGSGTVKVRTWMDTRISAEVVEKAQSINLTSIPRSSAISYVSDVTLGNICTVRWTPASKSFRYKIKFSVGDWSLTTVAIHPNVTTLYTNASYGISMSAAHQFPNSKEAEMTVTLYTYSDEGCTKQVGSADSKKCKVYIPENSDTLPTVKMSLSPVNSLSDTFKGLYIQNKTKVQANFAGSEAKYSASISDCSLDVNGMIYNEPYLSDLISKSGTVTVKGIAVDSRGFFNTLPQDITVIPYSKPSLIPYAGEASIICKRCASNGDLSPSGKHLRIKAGRLYSKVMSEEVQKNFSLVRFRYKVDGTTSWGEWITILDKNSSAESVDTTLTSLELSLSTTYLVQLEVVDDVGESYSTLITVPTADVTVHLREGGKAVGVGKYAEKDYIVDIDDEWDVNARGNLTVGGTLSAQHIATIGYYTSKDFNELVYDTGYYIGSAAPENSTCKNYPVNETGMLEVISAMVQNPSTLKWWGFAYQTYRTHTGKVYMRSYYSDTGWNAWKQVTLT